MVDGELWERRPGGPWRSVKTGERARLQRVMEQTAARGVSLRFGRFAETEYVLTGVGEFPDASTPADVVAKRA